MSHGSWLMPHESRGPAPTLCVCTTWPWFAARPWPREAGDEISGSGPPIVQWVIYGYALTVNRYPSNPINNQWIIHELQTYLDNPGMFMEDPRISMDNRSTFTENGSSITKRGEPGACGPYIGHLLGICCAGSRSVPCLHLRSLRNAWTPGNLLHH